MKNICKFVKENPTLVTAFLTALGTIALSIITGLYLFETKKMRVETKKMREIAYKTLKVDLSPKIFIDRIETERNLNESNKILEIMPVYVLENVGKSEATDVKLATKVMQGEKITDFSKFESGPDIYPTQEIEYRRSLILIKINDEYLDLMKKILNREITDFKETYWLPRIADKESHPVKIYITIKYLDHEKKECGFTNVFRYHMGRNYWSRIKE